MQLPGTWKLTTQPSHTRPIPWICEECLELSSTYKASGNFTTFAEKKKTKTNFHKNCFPLFCYCLYLSTFYILWLLSSLLLDFFCIEYLKLLFKTFFLLSSFRTSISTHSSTSLRVCLISGSPLAFEELKSMRSLLQSYLHICIYLCTIHNSKEMEAVGVSTRS